MSFLAELKRRNVLRVGAAYMVTAWLVVQVAETLFPVYGLSDGAIRTVVNVLAVGLVPVLILSWVFEWTPEGLKHDAEVDIDAPASVTAARQLDRIILIVLALALGYFAFDKFVLTPQQRATELADARQEGRSEALVESFGDASIAVLSFSDMSPDKDQEYLSDGLAEEVLHLLARIPELRVISRSSAFAYKGKDTPIPEIARQLNVSHVLEGSVRKAGDRIRITAQLIDARSDMHLWSETYDRMLKDIFVIQDELAAAIVDQLHVTLLGEAPQAFAANTDAFDLYLQGKHLLNADLAAEASELLRQAVEIDPEFVAAWADLTTSYVFSAPTMGRSDHSGDPIFPKLLAARDRLVELAPNHPLILSYGAWESIESSGDYHSAAAMLRTAVENNPNHPEVLRSASFLAMLFANDDLAQSISRRLVQVDPLCARCQLHHARVLMNAGRPAEALAALRKLLELTPEMAHTYEIGIAHLINHEAEQARAVFASHPDPNVRAWGALVVQCSMGDKAVPPDELAALDENMSEFNPRWMAELYAVAGYPGPAFQKLREASADTAIWRFAVVLRSPLLRELHGQASWTDMQQIAGVSELQLADIDFNPELKWRATGSK